MTFFSRFSEVGSLIPDLLDMVKHFFFFILKLHFVRTHADITTDNDGVYSFWFFFFCILFGRRKSINSFVILSVCTCSIYGYTRRYV